MAISHPVTHTHAGFLGNELLTSINKTLTHGRHLNANFFHIFSPPSALSTHSPDNTTSDSPVQNSQTNTPDSLILHRTLLVIHILFYP